MSALAAITLGRTDAEMLAWDQYVLNSAVTSGYHLSGWRQVIEEAFGHATCYVTVRDESEAVVGLVPLVFLASRGFGRFLVSLPFVNYGGMIADSPEGFRLLENEAIKQARALNAQHIELRHEAPIQTAWVSTQRKVSMRLPLPPSYEELLKGFPSKLRSQVRRAQKEGMTARVGGVECLDEFYAVFSRCMRDLGTPVYAKSFFGKILEVFPKDAHICVVSHQETPVAAGFLYGFRSSLEIPGRHRISVLTSSRPICCYMARCWNMRASRASSFLISADRARTAAPIVLRSSGAQPHQLYWYYWMKDGRNVPQLNPQNPKYALAIRLWQTLPVAVANFLGPHIVKHLP